ncbi:peptidase M20 [Paenibacillus sp. J31TS4]|uniref:M20 family metallopeptidase n=1 Tax=Paenibacillus sp. J31TS4 TaxID=2807195 RepID=UPI001B2ECC26|nr:M20 family metallopeptidase [Paenibacillus sp. J31TS4]GIP40071.1 peptidase M20 [Paenibacillus sp. J31TS4]
MSSSLLDRIHQSLPELLRLLEESVNQDSPSANKKLGDAMADWFADTFVRLTGGRVTRIPNETYGDPLVCELGNGPNRILLVGHYDTVWPEGEAAKRPFEIRDGLAYGPGVYDMKAGVLQAMIALKVLQEEGRLPADKTIALFLNSDEEAGSPSSREVIQREAAKAKAAFVLEPPMEPHGFLKTSRKGSGRFKLIVEGVSAHAGVNPEKGVSAIEEMANQILRLHALTDLARGTTVNVGIVRGGIGTNVVADRAEAEIDVRVATAEEQKRVEQAIRGLAPVLPGARLTVTGGMMRPPMVRTDATAALYGLARELGRTELSLAVGETATGGVSDGNLIAACGTPTLDGLGARGDYAHSPREYVRIDEIPLRTALLAHMIESC